MEYRKEFIELNIKDRDIAMVIQLCLSEEQNRPTAEELWEHPILKMWRYFLYHDKIEGKNKIPKQEILAVLCSSK